MKKLDSNFIGDVNETAWHQGRSAGVDSARVGLSGNGLSGN